MDNSSSLPTQRKIPKPSLIYYIVRWILGKVLNVFFQEIEVVGKENIPKEGPVIFVGNHPNQFVDGMMMFTQTPRDVFMVIAESSLKKYALIGFFAKLQHSIPVYRREDYAFKGVGEVSLIKKGKDFFVVGNVGGQNVKEGDIIEFLGTINDKGEGVQVTVIELANSVLRVKINAEELPDNFDFLSPEPIEYFNFKVLPKIDQSQSYHSIYGVLARGDCIGLFPEGGSSDKTQLRELKAGVAYLSLSLKQKYPNIKLSIVPCGLNYISGHRFRSKTLIEYGHPLTISPSLWERYSKGDKTAVSALTNLVNSRLRSVTLNIPESIANALGVDPFEATDIIVTARRLYQPSSVKLPVQKYLELNRRFAEAISKLIEDPATDPSQYKQIFHVLQEIKIYNSDRKALGLSDRQAQTSPANFLQGVKGFFTLITKIFFLLPSILAIPGILFHIPIGFLTKMKALSAASKSAANSTVKIEGRDVIASTKIAFGFIIMVIFYFIYGISAGLLWGLKYGLLVGFGVPFYTYFSCIDLAGATVRSTIPLAKFLIYRNYRKKCKELRERRLNLSEKVRQGVKLFGPKFKEYWGEHRLVSDALLQRTLSDYDMPFDPLRASYETSENQDIESDLFDELL